MKWEFAGELETGDWRLLSDLQSLISNLHFLTFAAALHSLATEGGATGE